MAKPRKATGRVTPSKQDRSTDADGRPAPVASSRYTPKQPAYRLRPGWHRWAGWIGVALGILVVASNDLMLMTGHLTLLPGGHNEVYLVLGIGIAAASTWFLGLFDRGTTVYD